MVRPNPRLRIIAPALYLLALLAPAAASAATAVIDWPTYLRAGPGKQFVVLQELARGLIIQIGDCNAQWCAVQIDRVAGYVDRTALGDKASISLLSPPTSNCFESQRTGYANGETFRYCPK